MVDRVSGVNQYVVLTRRRILRGKLEQYLLAHFEVDFATGSRFEKVSRVNDAYIQIHVFHLLRQTLSRFPLRVYDLTRSTGGIFQSPSMISFFGQYSRMKMLNESGGAGSQFDSLSLPGESR